MNYLEKFNDINTFIFDVDGVLTNNDLIVLENGQLLRKMNTRDGFAIRRALEEGYRICIITGGRSSGVVQRLKGLGVKDIYAGISNKLDAYEEFIQSYDINPATILYMGDDLPDYEVMRMVGLSACPQDAAHEIIELCQYISPYNGGEGCARDVIEKTMRIHEKWIANDKVLKPFPGNDLSNS